MCHGILNDDLSAYLNGKVNMWNIFSIMDFYLRGLGEFWPRLQARGVATLEHLGDPDFCGDAQLQKEIGMSKMQIRVFRQAFRKDRGK